MTFMRSAIFRNWLISKENMVVDGPGDDDGVGVGDVLGVGVEVIVLFGRPKSFAITVFRLTDPQSPITVFENWGLFVFSCRYCT